MFGLLLRVEWMAGVCRFGSCSRLLFREGDNVDIFEWILGVFVVFIFAVAGVGIYDAVYGEKIVLLKSQWVCTETKTSVRPQTTIVGKSPITIMVPHSDCVEYQKSR